MILTDQCALRTTVWRGKGAQRVRVTPLRFIPIPDHRHRCPQADGVEAAQVASTDCAAGYSDPVWADLATLA